MVGQKRRSRKDWRDGYWTILGKLDECEQIKKQLTQGQLTTKS